MYYIAENLELRCQEVAQRISDMTGRSVEDCKTEVDLSIQRLFYWGAYADKFGGTVQVCGSTKCQICTYICYVRSTTIPHEGMIGAQM